MAIEGKSIKSLADIARELGISAWDKLNGNQVAKILELAGLAKINELQIQKIIEVSKGFAPLAASVFQTIQVAADRAGGGQQKLIANHSATAKSSLETLKDLLKETRDEDNRIKLAAMIADLAKEELKGIQSMNQNNNRFWAIFSGVAASVAGVGLLALRLAR